MTLDWLDWLVVAIYCVLCLALWLWVSRRGADTDTDSYFLSGRSLPWWIAGASMAASAFSLDTPLYVAGLTRRGGVAGNWEWWFMGVSGVLGATIMARYWRRAGITTDLELITLRYSGTAAHVLRATRAVFFGLVFNPLGMASVLTAVVKLLGFVAPELVGPGAWPTLAGWGVLGGVVGVAVVYSVLSGFMGVVLTDLIQFVIAMVGAVVMAVYAISYAGGWSAVVNHPAVVEKSAFLPDLSPWSGQATRVAVFLGVMWWTFVNADGGGKYIQRMASCRDEREAERATWFSTLSFVALRSWPWILVALAGLVLYPDLAEGKGEDVYPTIMMRLPSGVRGLVFASLIAAFMSTIDTMLNWGASYLVNDLVEPYLLPGRDEAAYVRLAKLVALPTLVIAALFFLALNPPPSFAPPGGAGALAVTKALRAVILVSSGLGAVYLLRWFWWRLTAWGEVAAMIGAPAGALLAKQAVTAWNAAHPPLSEGEAFALSALGVSALTVGLAALVSLLGPKSSPERLRAFVARVHPAGFWGPHAAEGRPGVAGWLLLRFAAGNAVLFGATFAIGGLVLGRPAWVALSATLAFAAGLGVDRLARRRLEASGFAGAVPGAVPPEKPAPLPGGDEAPRAQVLAGVAAFSLGMLGLGLVTGSPIAGWSLIMVAVGGAFATPRLLALWAEVTGAAAPTSSDQ
ncbi:MAG: hypothetical protein AB7T09_37665 [Planctomycetota bacterium]